LKIYNAVECNESVRGFFFFSAESVVSGPGVDRTHVGSQHDRADSDGKESSSHRSRYVIVVHDNDFD
jgi:hypothetical protein